MKKTIEATEKLLRFAPHETCLHMHHNFFSIHAVIKMVFELFSSNNIITPDYRTALHVARARVSDLWIQQVLQRQICILVATHLNFRSFIRCYAFSAYFSNIFRVITSNWQVLLLSSHCGTFFSSTIRQFMIYSLLTRRFLYAKIQ